MVCRIYNKYNSADILNQLSCQIHEDRRVVYFEQHCKTDLLVHVRENYDYVSYDPQRGLVGCNVLRYASMRKNSELPRDRRNDKYRTQSSYSKVS